MVLVVPCVENCRTNAETASGQGVARGERVRVANLDEIWQAAERLADMSRLMVE